MGHDDFVRVAGPLFEASPWIAASAAHDRPFESLKAMHHAFCEVVRNAGVERQLALIRAHPDLAGRLALAGGLTSASSSEQSSAGLDRLTPEEIAQFQRMNSAYRQRFGFPFVICARLNHKAAILESFGERLGHSPAEEIATALGEIEKIAWLRIVDLAGDR